MPYWKLLRLSERSWMARARLRALESVRKTKLRKTVTTEKVTQSKSR